MSGILIVDDNPLQLNQLKSILNEAGYPVIGAASSGTEAVKLLRSIHPSLITLDIVMPDMNGLDLLRSIRAAYPSIPVMVCSSFGHEVVADLARRSGAFAFFPKPYPTLRLLQEVERMIGPPKNQVPDLS
ncbi:response regulator [Methanospirillum lacunae]|uniref:Two-component system response regulator n=1 Tax=Methanospirillum lacunae TaxID=668570 RepID=A0A2V2N1F3_9EURY|nr:response regulator [Methanospirillum lacunae]PWR69977.1 two-component system response regulator [Methanospirillum lacunae]